MSEKQFVNGLFVFKPHEKAPDFVKANLSINRDEFVNWLQEQEPDEKGRLKIDLKESKKGSWYAHVNEWKPDSRPVYQDQPQAFTPPVPPQSGGQDDIQMSDIPF